MRLGDRIIRFFGGFTEDEVQKIHDQCNEEVRQLRFAIEIAEERAQKLWDKLSEQRDSSPSNEKPLSTSRLPWMRYKKYAEASERKRDVVEQHWIAKGGVPVGNGSGRERIEEDSDVSSES